MDILLIILCIWLFFVIDDFYCDKFDKNNDI